MLKVSRVLIAKGVTLPEWAYDFWAYVLNEIQRTHLVIQRDFESRGECGIYIDTFFKKRGIEIPLSKVLLRSKADWAGHADYRKEVLMCKVDEDLFKKLEAGSSIHTLMNKYRGTFFHELGHLLDKSIQYKDPKGLKYPERGFEGSYGVHAKFPTEWRAYAAEIQGDLYERSRWDFAQGDETIADYLGANSPEWNARERYLPPEGRRYILEIFAKILLKDPGYFSKSVPLEKIHPFKSLGQFVTVAVHIQNSPQVPFHNFLIDQLEDIPEEVTDPFKLDIQWVNYRMDFLYDVYDREKPRILNSWIKHLNKMIDETPVESCTNLVDLSSTET